MGENITRGKVNSLSKICSPERRVFAQFILYRHYFFFHLSTVFVGFARVTMTTSKLLVHNR